MAIRLFELAIFAIIGILAFTEFFIPMIMDKPLFGSFRKAKPAVEPVKEETKAPGDLGNKIKDAKEKVKEVKKVQDEVAEFHKSAEELKKEADDMLK